MKYTKKEVQGMFVRLVKASKKQVGPIYINDNTDTLNYESGGWCLDYTSVYGGYVIEEIGDKGSVNHPFGAMRRNAREMYLSMYMTTQALEMLNNKEI